MNRLPPRPVDEWEPATRSGLTAYLRRPALYAGADARPMPNALGLLAHQPTLGEAWLAFNKVLAADTKLEERLRELIILRVAWRTRSTYEWYQHVRMGHAAGITTEQLHAVPEGPASDVWSAVERAVLAAVDDIVDGYRVGGSAWAELRAHFDEATLLEILFIAGAYVCFAVVTNSTMLEPDPAFDPVDAPALPNPDQ